MSFCLLLYNISSRYYISYQNTEIVILLILQPWCAITSFKIAVMSICPVFSISQFFMRKTITNTLLIGSGQTLPGSVVTCHVTCRCVAGAASPWQWPINRIICTGDPQSHARASASQFRKIAEQYENEHGSFQPHSWRVFRYVTVFMFGLLWRGQTLVGSKMHACRMIDRWIAK